MGLLASVTKPGQTIQYAYNHNGLRVKKTVNGVETHYTLRGKEIVHLKKGTTQMHFYYDGQGKPGLVTYNGSDYYYMYNLQGDVVGLVGPSNQLVVEYRYDPWGKQLVCTGSMATTLGMDNPFRYRGYVYDVETGVYSLPARYHNPVWGRFINADTLAVRNMFAYCVNNPIAFKDPTGLHPTEATNGYEVQKLEAQEKKAYAAAIRGAETTGGGSHVGGGGSYDRGSGRSFAPTPVPSSNIGWYNDDSSPNWNSIPEAKPTNTPKLLVIFPEDPTDFNPNYCYSKPFPGTRSGAIIAWFLIGTTEPAIFRWDEGLNDPKGAHYHIIGYIGPEDPHFRPGTEVLDPWATAFFED